MSSKHALRIIAGRWRGRKIPVLDLPGLRPTTDRIRETLFNWLTPYINHSRCLDLFSGSGALGLEALSRGASHVFFVDKHPQVIQQIKKNLQALNATTDAESLVASIPDNHIKLGDPYDIIFLDPPFQQNLLPACLHWLSTAKLLTPQTIIYIEHEIALEPSQAIANQAAGNFSILKHKFSKTIHYYLIRPA